MNSAFHKVMTGMLKNKSIVHNKWCGSSNRTDFSSYIMNTIFFSSLPVHLFGCMYKCRWRQCQKSRFANVNLPILLCSSLLQIKLTQWLIFLFIFFSFFLNVALDMILGTVSEAKVYLNKFKLYFFLLYSLYL